MENIYDVQLFPDIPALVEENVQVWNFITISWFGCDKKQTENRLGFACEYPTSKLP